MCARASGKTIRRQIGVSRQDIEHAKRIDAFDRSHTPSRATTLQQHDEHPYASVIATNRHTFDRLATRSDRRAIDDVLA
jgi:hypothetical protein